MVCTQVVYEGIRMTDYRAIAEELARHPRKSTAYMSHDERADGIQTMLEDLETLAVQDGHVAAAWALEFLTEPEVDGNQ